MVFVGRQREIARTIGQLQDGGNVVVRGKLGIGRTSIVRRVGDIMGDGWSFHFESFSQGPAGICFGLLRQLGLRPTTSRGHMLSFVSARARLLRAKPPGGGRHVLVFDDIEAVTAPKLALIRALALTGHYQLVAIVDHHIGESELFDLKASLYPVRVVTLFALPLREAEEFFARASEELALGLGAGEIAGLAKTSGGYPLMMVEAVAFAARQRTGSAGRGPASWVGGPLGRLAPHGQTEGRR